MTRTHIPEAVLTAAHDRARAREARDWAEADRLRSEIGAAGWKIVDRGTDFALSIAVPPDVADGELVRYGASTSVPSRADEPATGLATVVLLATDWPDDLERALTGLLAHAPDGTSVVIVADAPSAAQATALDALTAAPETTNAPHLPIETAWTSDRLGHAAATNIGIRRAQAPVVILLDTSLEPTGDFITPLVRALDDASVAVVGGWGITSTDLRRFEDAPAGDVDAIEGYCQAFRRADAIERGPLDERFRFYRNLDIWWSLVLRDADEGEPPRRAVRLDGLPLARHEHRGWASLRDDERDRQSRRNFYRIIDRFGSRRDLLVTSGDA
ncbi:MAG: glycosyltransferase [Chloroflexi bacterium]|nr:glycosyltransferase [Chloroflexota bacterium]